MKVTIVDYNCGNVVSLGNALEHLKAEVTVSSGSTVLNQSEKIIIPGVGAFGYGMANLKQKNLVEKLNEAIIGREIPVLGICLGAQLMLSKSEESEGSAGLDWVGGEVKKIPPGNDRVPHVGWNHTQYVQDSLFSKKEDQKIYYYTHSYFMDLYESQNVVAKCDYALGFAAVFQKNHIWGCQFHPEKSQKHGLDFLERFIRM